MKNDKNNYVWKVRCEDSQKLDYFFYVVAPSMHQAITWLEIHLGKSSDHKIVEASVRDGKVLFFGPPSI